MGFTPCPQSHLGRTDDHLSTVRAFTSFVTIACGLSYWHRWDYSSLLALLLLDLITSIRYESLRYSHTPSKASRESEQDFGIVVFSFSFYYCCSAAVMSLCDPVDCSPPGFTVLHCLPKFAQIHIHWVDDAILHLILCCPLLLCLQSFSGSGSFPMSWFFSSDGQSVGALASASVLAMNI